MAAGTTMTCPDDETLVAHVDRRLEEEKRAAVEEHVERCERCGAALRAWVEAFGVGAATTIAEQEHPLVAVSPGTRLGRYTVEKELGRGGMGVVYSAYDPELDRRVAIKVLFRAATGDRAQLRTLREAQAMARLTHPNVVTVFEVGTEELGVEDLDAETADEHASSSAQRTVAFVAMELVTGTTLRQWLKEQPRSWPEIIAAFADAGRGLAVAHEAGLVHCDFKPDNVLIDERGYVRVTDFGLARFVGAAAESPPAAGDVTGPEAEAPARSSVGGTLPYLAPETMTEAPGPAADQFAFCVSLYEAMCGVVPFVPLPLHERLQQIEAGAFMRSEHTPRPSARVRRVLARGLAADPGARFESMGPLLLALDRATRTRRWLPVGVATAVATTVGFAAFVRPGADPGPEYCDDPRRHLSGVWDEPARAAMAGRFAQHDGAFAARAAEIVMGRLDDHAKAWVTEIESLCSASASSSQPDVLLAVRGQCLSETLAELETMVNVLLHGDERTFAGAIDAVHGLSPLSRCSADSGVFAPDPQPGDGPLRAEVTRLRIELARARSLVAAGAVADASGKVESVVEAARALGYDPLLAEALVRQGVYELQRGDADLAWARADEALRHAIAGRHDRAASDAYRIKLTVASTAEARFDEARDYGALALTHLQAVGGAPQQEREILLRLGYVEFLAEDLPTAQRLWNRAAGLSDPENPHHALADAMNQAFVAFKRGDVVPAADAFERWLRTGTELYGPKHPVMHQGYYNAGGAQCSAGRIAEGLRRLESAAEIVIANHGRRHPDVARAYLSSVSCLLSADRLDEAQEHHRQAIAASPPQKDLGLELRLQATETRILARRERFPQSEAAFAEVEAATREHYGAVHARNAELRLDFGLSLLRAGRADLARPYLRHAHALLQPAQGHAALRLVSAALGRAEADGGDLARAERLLNEALSTFEPRHGRVRQRAAAHQALAIVELQRGGAAARNHADAAVEALRPHPDFDVIYEELLSWRAEQFRDAGRR